MYKTKILSETIGDFFSLKYEMLANAENIMGPLPLGTKLPTSVSKPLLKNSATSGQGAQVLVS